MPVLIFLFFLSILNSYQIFDAWDSFYPIPIIHTKIVNKKFKLFLNTGNLAEYRLYDMNNDKNLTPWKKFNSLSVNLINNSKGIFYDEFKINKAVKNVKVQFRFCQNKDFPGIPVPLKNCENNSINIKDKINTNYGKISSNINISINKINGKISVSNSSKNIKISENIVIQYEYNTSLFSSDNFAIRPDKFKFTDIPSKVKAGEEFNITIKALDYENNPTKDYNEILSLSESPELVYKIAKSGCYNGKLEIVDGGEFKDGVAKVKLKYNEVGELNLTIKEVKGGEFAKVDEDDNWFDSFNSNDIFITSDKSQILFIPYNFNINANFINFKNKEFTYIASNLDKMASTLNLFITSINKDRNITKNYNKLCYAKDLDINISNYVNGDINTTIIFKDIDGSESESNISKPLILSKISKNYFSTDNNGSTTINIKINFKKDYRYPVSEFNMTITDVNISDGDITKTISVNKFSTFRYGKIDIKNIITMGNKANFIAKYEYWTKGGWQVNKNHYDIFGKIKSYLPIKDINITLNNPVNDGTQNISITTNHSLPYFVKIHLAIPSWLWYHPLAKTYKDPSKTNLDCLTHPCLNVGFNQSSKGWGGIGITPSKYDTTNGNRTVHINSSNKIKINKLEVKKLNW